jgi:hypothetical protein
LELFFFLSTLSHSLFRSGLYALSSNDIKVGINLEVDGAPWKIIGNKLNPSSFTSVSAPHRMTLPNSVRDCLEQARF